MSAAALSGIGASTGTPPRPVRSQLPVSAPDAPDAIVEQTPAKILAALTPPSTRLSIVHDEATGRYVFKSIDEKTGEVVRQYPTEDMLSQIARVREITGLTVDTGA